MASKNPCVECGACCAFFRVSFFWEETSPDYPDGVPADQTEPLDSLLQCMNGTNQPHPRCACLDGRIGQKVACTIYQRRSSTCRDFGLHEKEEVICATGEDLIRCNEARKAWGLPPLTRWQLRYLPHTPKVRHKPGLRHPVHHSHLH